VEALFCDAKTELLDKGKIEKSDSFVIKVLFIDSTPETLTSGCNLISI
jgi:hypothetical protein